MIPALLWEKTGTGKVRCQLCAHHCLVKEGQRGVCRVRKNIGGELFSLNADRIVTLNLDPIEKKPLYHFQPASASLSAAAMGCNFSCPFCQNHAISVVAEEEEIAGETISAHKMVDSALASGARSISYTYTEPTVYFEWMLETARLAAGSGLANVMVTNGFMSAAALEMIAPFLNAANVDIKAFSEDFYKKYCAAKLQPVLDTVRRMHDLGIWVEVTTLVIPGLNTDPEEMQGLIRFLLSVAVDMPWHVSCFFPQYKLRDIPPTDAETVRNFLQRGKEMGLQFVYSGNMADDEWSNTYCPNCRTRLLERVGYHTRVTGLKDGRCGKCGQNIAGVWNGKRSGTEKSG